LRDEPTLSVYINGAVTDPAERGAWRTRLEQSLASVRANMGSGPAEGQRQLEQCLARLEQLLPTVPSAIGSPGWAAFITADAVHFANALPVPVPTAAWWGRGMFAAPFARALKEYRPVIVAIASEEVIHFYRYLRGDLQAIEAMRARGGEEPAAAMRGGSPSRFRPGSRGVTAADEADRLRRHAREELVRTAAQRLTALAGATGWIISGGATRMAKRLTHALPSRIGERMLEMPVLRVDATPAEIRRAAARAASELRRAEDDREIAALIARAASDGRGVVGIQRTRRALERGAVHALYISHHYLERSPLEAEEAVRSALEQGAAIEDVTGPAADRLDEECGGMCARLRFST
jgi:hypothetical protein